MKTFFSALIASFFLYLSFASAAGEFDSLESRTQFDFTGGAGYSTYNSISWGASAAGFHYVTPHFGVGGAASVSRWGSPTDGIWYSLGPAVEYFIPVGERGHVFTQAIASISGQELSGSELSLTGRLGYRYFVSDDVAISLRLVQSWRRENASGASTKASNLMVDWGFSIFF